MSHATYGVVYLAQPGVAATGSSAASTLFGTVATAGGVLVAGAAIYMVAQRMRSDYCAALTECQSRTQRESAAFASQNAAFAAAQGRAREMSLVLAESAREDPNTAFFLGGLGRLKAQLGGLSPDGSGPTNGVALLAQQCDELLNLVAAGGASTQWAAYEKLANQVAQLEAQSKTAAPGSREANALKLVCEQLTLLRADIDDSALALKRHAPIRTALLERLDEIERLATTQALTALQSLSLLRDRVRGEMRAAGEVAVLEARHAARMRDLVGEISANAQAVLKQDVLTQPHQEAEAVLRKLSSLVSASPIELTALEALAVSTQTLFENTQKAIEEQAMEKYLEDQVQQVLGGLGYRVTMATNGDDSKMVAVLDSGLGVQLNLDGKGNLEGEMVAFSESAATVDASAEDKVCNLMDDIFDGLRRRNLVVLEKKRRTFKPGRHTVPVVQSAVTPSEKTAPTVQKPLEMRIGE